MAEQFTKTATQLLYSKRPGDILITYHGGSRSVRREQDALVFLLMQGYIKFVNRMNYLRTDKRGKEVMEVETHYMVLKRPEWMDQ
jgi:hypothetical protein